MTRVVYDAGALVAADRNDRRLWARHRVLLESGLPPYVPAAVVAQVSRSPKQANLRRLLRGCEVVGLDEAGAHRAGALLGKSRTSDVSDATVVDVAISKHATIVTEDADDIRHLLAAARSKLAVVGV